MKKKGFTLIEILAVIVILAIIALISTPVILGVIDDTKKEAFKNSSLNIFKAAELYETKNDFKMINNEGISLIGDDLPLENNNFRSGQIIRNNTGVLELLYVSDGTYCAKGIKTNLRVVKGGCYQLDDTAPVDTAITIDSITSNSFRVIVTAEDLESGIKSYNYSIDGINYVKSTNNTYIFTNLKLNETYTVYVKITNNNNLTSEIISKSVTTNDITAPTYSIDKTGWQVQKVVTIGYPARETGFIYEYSIDGGTTWTTVFSGITTNVTFNANGSVIARIYNGTSYKTASSYTVSEVDATSPTAGISLSSKTTNTITVVASGIDTESGIIKYEFSIDGGSYISNGINPLYTFSNVTTGSHTIKTRVTNGSGLTTESTTLTVTPNEIIAPTYNVDKTGWQVRKIVTIDYPERQTGFIYEYSTNGGTTWITVASGITTNVTFNANGSVIARIYDGVNYKKASSYVVNQIDTTAPTNPTINGGSTSYATSRTITVLGVTDNESGIARYEYYLSANATVPIVSTSGTNNGTNASKVFNSNYVGYYVYFRAIDNVGNISNWSNAQRLYIDINSPTITAKGASYTITEGNSNVLSSTYFNISQNGDASITTTACVDTSNSNVVVANTSTLGVGNHVIRCTVTKETGLSANAQTTIVVNPAYTCSKGTLTYDATRGYICVFAKNQSCYTECPDGWWYEQRPVCTADYFHISGEWVSSSQCPGSVTSGTTNCSCGNGLCGCRITTSYQNIPVAPCTPTYKCSYYCSSGSEYNSSSCYVDATNQ